VTGGVLAHRQFRRLWIAGLLDDTTDWMLVTAVPIFVYQLTDSTLITSAAFLIELIPGIVFSPLAGVAADVFDRRRLLIICALLQAALVALLLPVDSRGTLWLLYLAITFRAICTQFVLPAKNSLLPTLVDPGQAVAANSLVALNTNLGRLAGSLFGGVAVSGQRLAPVSLGALAAFLLVAGITTLIRAPRSLASSQDKLPGQASVPDDAARSETDVSRWWVVAARHWWEGVQVIVADRQLRGTFASAALCAVGQGIFSVLFVVFVVRSLHGGDAEVGLLRGVQGIGGVVGGITLGALGRRLRPAPLITWGALSFAVIAALLWNATLVTTAIGLYAGLFMIGGIPGSAYNAGLLGLIQERVPARYLGRAVGSFYTTYNGAQAVGMAIAGVLGDQTGPIPLLNGQAALYLCAGLLTLYVLRRQVAMSR
jgi:MFS family permease